MSYAIGIAEPLSVYVDSYGTVREGMTDQSLVDVVVKHFDLRPGVLVRRLGLKQPVFAGTACGGHFGRSDYCWEQPVMLPSI